MEVFTFRDVTGRSLLYLEYSACSFQLPHTHFFIQHPQNKSIELNTAEIIGGQE